MVLRKYFCFELPTTGLIIGWFGLAQSIVSVTSCILMLVNVDYYIKNGMFPNDMDIETERHTFIALTGTSLALNIIDILSSVLLIMGSTQKKPLLLIPWLLNTGLSILFGSIGIVIAGVVLMFYKDTIAVGIIILAVGSIFITFAFYTWIAIYSFYRLLRASNPEQQRLLGNVDTRTYTRIL